MERSHKPNMEVPTSKPAEPLSPSPRITRRKHSHPFSPERPYSHTRQDMRASSEPLRVEHAKSAGRLRHSTNLRPASRGISRPSTTTGQSPQVSESSTPNRTHRPSDRISHLWMAAAEGTLVIEERIGDNDTLSEYSLVYPDEFEDAESVAGEDREVLPEGHHAEHDIVNDLERLNCDAINENLLSRRRRRRQERLRLFKRKLDQRSPGDTDTDDTERDEERRFRRRLHSPSPVPSQFQAFLDPADIEPRNESQPRPRPAARVVSDSTTEPLPFWDLRDPMIMDSDPSRPTSSHYYSDAATPAG